MILTYGKCLHIDAQKNGTWLVYTATYPIGARTLVVARGIPDEF